MKAIVKYTPYKGDTQLVEVPRPKPNRGEVIVKVAVAGICGTDLRYYLTDEGTKKLKTPVIMGHEGSGTIVELGEGVSGLSIGDRVVSETTFNYCKVCVYCKAGNYHMCMTNRTSLGTKQDGFFAEYIRLKEEFVHKLPDHITFTEGLFIEPISCSARGVLERSIINPGDVCVVFGPGPLGLVTSQIAKLAGARVILVGTKRGSEKLKLAQSFGIYETLITGVDDIEGYIKEITNGLGADVIYECSGSVNAMMESFKITRKQGQIVLLAAPTSISFNPWNDVCSKEINIYTAYSSSGGAWHKAKKIVFSGQVKLKELVSHRFKMEEWEKAFEMAASSESIKVLMYPDEFVE